VSVRGVLQVHSAPPALCPHIEWAIAGVLGMPVDLSWVDQPAAPGMVRAELEWQGRPGAAAAVTSALAGWNRLRFEASEDASPGCDAVRYSYTPSLGLFSATTMANGDITVPESRLRAALTVAAAAAPSAPRGGVPGGRPPGGCPDGAVRGGRLSGACPDGEVMGRRPPGEGLSLVGQGTAAALPPGRDPAGVLAAEISRLLGEPWDRELEPFRCAAEGAPVRWLHATG
jgi:hypothetical protein